MFSRLSLCPLSIVRGMQMFSSFYSLVKTHRHSLHLPTFTSTFFGDCSSLFASRRFFFSPCISSEEHFGLNVQLLSWQTAEETPIQAEKTKCLWKRVRSLKQGDPWNGWDLEILWHSAVSISVSQLAGRGKVSHRTPISQRLHLSLSKSHWLLNPANTAYYSLWPLDMRIL